MQMWALKKEKMLQHDQLALVSLFYAISLFLKQNHKHRTKRLLHKLKRSRQALNVRLNLIFTQQVTAIFNQIITQPIPEELIGDAIRYKRIWKKERSEDHWIRIVLEKYSDVEWIENFRMSKKTFQELCNRLKHELKPKPLYIFSREPLSVEKQVAVALYKMASCAEYRVVGSLFGIHKSTVKKCLYRVVAAINKVIVPTEICLPNELEADYIALQFENKTNIPQIIGCIDGTHVPILAPEEGYRDFVNRKGWPSYNVQAIVDHNGRFRNIVAKHPGSAHDARVFKDSLVYKHSASLIPKGSKDINGCNIPFMLVGDPAYPLLPWLLKEYPGTVSEAEESFNVYLGSARVAVEMAFGRLKARWRMLLKRMDVNYKFVPQLIIACCALHNIVEQNHDVFLMHWMDVVLETEKLYEQPSSLTNRVKPSVSASNIRNHLMRYLAENFPLRKSSLRRN